MNRRALLLALPLLPAFPALAMEKEGIPALFYEKELSPALIAEAVNHFVAMGEKKATRQLESLFTMKNQDPPLRAPLPRAAWVARLLYLPKGKKPLRDANIGATPLPEASMPAENWPLLPMAQSGNSIFVLTEGYQISGFPEPISLYLKYCRKNGVFRTTPLPVPTQEQALQDATALRESAAWKAVQWQGPGQRTGSTLDEATVWKHVREQAERVK